MQSRCKIINEKIVYETKIFLFINKGGWLVFMGRDYYANVDETAQNNIVLLYEYVKSKGVVIMNVSDTLQYYLDE